MDQKLSGNIVPVYHDQGFFWDLDDQSLLKHDFKLQVVTTCLQQLHCIVTSDIAVPLGRPETE